MKIRWGNIPLPEGHLAGLAAGFLLQRYSGLILFSMPWLLAWVGWALVAAGFGYAAWAVLEAGDQMISSRDTLLKTGPYALSRNPMYVGWHGMYLGLALGMRSAWLILLFPLVALYTHHKEIRSEERILARKFKKEYQTYMDNVPRYI